MQRAATAEFHQQQIADGVGTTIRSVSGSSRIIKVPGIWGKGQKLENQKMFDLFVDAVKIALRISGR